MEKLAQSQLVYEHIDHTIQALDLEELHDAPSLLALPQSDWITDILKLYAHLRPLLSAIAILPLIPPGWRAVLAAFLEKLDKPAATGAPDGTVTIPEKPSAATKQFKAGKDQAGRKRRSKLTFRPIRKVARDARTGSFISRGEARRRPSTTVVETITYRVRPAARKQ